jgi:hypothetical protein
MSDYTKAFNGAALDADESAVNPLFFESEFDKIEAAIKTKVDDIVGGTNDQLIKVDANGNFVDAGGITVANLTGVSTNVQTAIDAGYNTPTPDDDLYQSGGLHHFKNGAWSLSGTAIHNDTWRTIGGVGSGADTEVFWFDERVPSDATHVLFYLNVEVDNDGGSTADAAAQGYVADGDDTPSLTDKYLVLSYNDRIPPFQRQGAVWCGWVPIGTTNRTIQVHVVSDSDPDHGTLWNWNVLGSLRAGG